MNSTERIIGALQEFKSHTEKRFDRLESKVDSFQQFRWKVAGGLAVLSTLVVAVFELLRNT
jgi:hypothetical protein